MHPVRAGERPRGYRSRVTPGHAWENRPVRPHACCLGTKLREAGHHSGVVRLLLHQAIENVQYDTIDARRHLVCKIFSVLPRLSQA